MRAIRISSHGGPEAMGLVDVDAPAPGPHEIRIRHAAIGVNFIDAYHRAGLYKTPLPSGLGQEAAGIVDAVGQNVTRFALGDRAGYCTSPIGAYCEAHVVSEARAVKLPDAISYDIAAASLLKGMTARYLLRKTFRVEQGHWVLIHAAAGGVGQILVQWAKHLGARVIAAVGSAAKAETARELGADRVLVFDGGDFAPRVRAIVNEGVHVVYDGIGADTWAGPFDSLRPLGMMVSFGNASGSPERGAVKIAPPTRYALAGAAQAHGDLEAPRATGSLALVP